MTLAIFDLDNTLIAGDSDYLWGQFLVEQGLVDGDAYEAANNRFYEDYREGKLDIDAFLRFALKPLTEHDLETLHAWRDQFIEEKIRPILLPSAMALLDAHRKLGHTLLIITATNRFVTQPIASLYGIDHLIATAPELKEGRYSGGYEGIPCFREGKVVRLDHWLATEAASLQGSWFYSDSHNDLPMLRKVDHPVAVDPDETLQITAEEEGWPVISLRDPDAAAVLRSLGFQNP